MVSIGGKGGNLTKTQLHKKLEMLARLRVGHRDGQQADDFGGWVKTTVVLLAVRGSKFMKFWDDAGDPS